MPAGEAALETILDQVVGPVAIAEQGERVAPQMRDLLDDQALDRLDPLGARRISATPRSRARGG